MMARDLLPIDQMPEEARYALAGIEIEELFEFDRESKHRIGYLRKMRFAGKMTGAGVPGEASRNAA